MTPTPVKNPTAHLGDLSPTPPGIYRSQTTSQGTLSLPLHCSRFSQEHPTDGVAQTTPPCLLQDERQPRRLPSRRWARVLFASVPGMTGHNHEQLLLQPPYDDSWVTRSMGRPRRRMSMHLNLAADTGGMNGSQGDQTAPRPPRLLRTCGRRRRGEAGQPTKAEVGPGQTSPGSWQTTSRDGGNWNGPVPTGLGGPATPRKESAEDGPAVPCEVGLTRRSGCFPAEPYPPASRNNIHIVAPTANPRPETCTSSLAQTQPKGGAL